MNILLEKHFEKCGFDSDFFTTYEDKAVDEMQNVRVLCEQLHSIRRNNRQIVIYTDFDVDGIMSSIVAYAGLSELGFDVQLFPPTPAAGYGFRTNDVDDIMNLYPEATVILTGDVGISSNEAVTYAKSKGFMVFVTDHHIGHCDADVAVDPNQLGETYSHNNICGSYVLYEVIQTFVEMYGTDTQKEDIEKLKLFAGIATISDTMSLLYENRELVRDSIAIARQLFINDVPQVLTDNPHSLVYVRAFVGMKELLVYFQKMRKIKKAGDIDEQFYGFYLVPFLNSCKRMDGDMRKVYDIFFSVYVHPFREFPNIACVDNGIEYVQCMSDERKALTAQYFDALTREREADVTENAHYMQCGVYITDARAGLLGLLGSKFIGITGQPTLVVNANDDGSYSGSGRNPSWFDFAAELQAYGSNIVCSGHKEAFGVFIPNKDELLNYFRFFRDVFLPAQALMLLETENISTVASVSYDVGADCVLNKALIKEFMCEKELYHPYGRAFPEPVFDFYVTDDSSVKHTVFGSDNQHIKLIMPDGLQILLFYQREIYEQFAVQTDGDLCLVCRGTFHYDDFNRSEPDAVNFIANEFWLANEV